MLKATYLTILSCTAASFTQAAEVVKSLSSATFHDNHDRWPVQEPKFTITNIGSHPDRENFENYKVERGGQLAGTLSNIPRGEVIDLIKAALELVSQAEGGLFLKLRKLF